MAIYLRVPFNNFSAGSYPYTHPDAGSDPNFDWHTGDGSSSTINGTADSYTVTWSGADEWAHRYLSNGGYDGGGCAHIVQRSGRDQYQLGWVFSGGAMKTWSIGAIAYFRFRMRFDTIWRWDGEATMQNKLLDWGAESGGGNRVILMNECPHTGDVCTIPSSTYSSDFGGFSLKQGIGGEIGQNLCTPGYPVTFGTWYHIQGCVQSSNSSTGHHKLWINNNDFSNPTAQWLNRNIGVADWGDSWDMGGFISETPSRDQGWRYQHLEIGDSFDASWFPGGSEPPSSPRVFGVRA